MLFNRLRTALIAVREAEPGFAFDEKVVSWLLYEAATQVLPPREKHDEYRNGLPLLLNTAVSLVGRRLADQASENAKK